MNRHVPHFLQRLLLELDADSKTIRRSYARELKLIDQEQNLSGFQLLREAYEAALDWARHNQPQPQPEPGQRPEQTPPKQQLAAALPQLPEVILAPAPTPAPLPEALLPLLPPPPPPPPPPETTFVKPPPPVFDAAENPHALADTVFARLVANTARIVELGMFKDATLLETELRNRLADEELFNITARKLFEARVADLLFSEYSLVAGVLFGAAATVFGWEKDSRRLQPFGQAGAFLDRAIVERTMFRGQLPEELARQRAVMARLRQARRASIVQIRRDMAYVERMHTRFPTLMAIMVSRDTVQEWRSQNEATSAAQVAHGALPAPVLAGHATKRRFDGAWIFFAIVAAFLVMALWETDGSTPVLDPASVEQSSQYPKYAPGADPSAPDYNPRPNPSQAATGAQTRLQATGAARFDKRIVDAIVKDIKYTPAANAPYGVRRVVYDILTADNGHIYGMNRLQRSIDPAYDEAVKAAIMRAKTLPANYRSPVRMVFSIEMRKPARKQQGRARVTKEPAPSAPSANK